MSLSSVANQHWLLNLAGTVKAGVGKRAVLLYLVSGNIRREEFVTRRGTTSIAMKTVAAALYCCAFVVLWWRDALLFFL